MGIFSRVIKTIFLILGVYLLTVNVIVWANSKEVTFTMVNTNLSDFSSFQNSYHMNDYRGFEWFFDRISTFPMGTTFRSTLQHYSDILSSFPQQLPENVLDWLSCIFELLFSPLLFLVSMIIDVIASAFWFLGFTW